MSAATLFRNAPLAFGTGFLGVAPRPWQQRAALRIRERLVRGQKHVRVHIRTCHGAGKTFFCSWLLLWYMTTRKQARGFTTAPTWAQVSGLLWSEIRAMHSRSALGKTKFGEVYDSPLFKIHDDWWAVGASSDRPENLEGHHSPTAAIRITDEAKAVPLAIRRATQGMLDAPESLDIAISTPWTRSGWFYEQDVANDPDLIRIVVTVDDLIADGVRSAEQRDVWAREWGGEDSPDFRARAMAEYIETDPFGAVRAASLEACVKRGRATSPVGNVIVGVDVARSTDGDESVIAVADDEGVVKIVPLRIRDVVQVARRAVQVAREYGARTIRVDSVGVGAGPVDVIRAEGFDGAVEEFVSGAAAGDTSRFANRYAEAVYEVVARINAGAVSLPADETLKAQLLQVKFEPTAGGKIRAEKKPDGAKSPDRFDAVMIALAPPTVSEAARLLDAFRSIRRAAA